MVPWVSCQAGLGRKWRVLYLVWHLLSRALAFHVSLHFDGSLKRPRDVGFPVDSLGRIATASACIQVEDDLLLGGKWFVPEQWTSAHAEYEALLLGLEELSRVVLSSQNKIDNNSSTIDSLYVAGDCKMVIQQLQGRANPRKMESFHQRAQGLLESIACSNVTFQHIPREENVLCDRLCASITHVIVQQAHDSLDHDLSLLWKESDVGISRNSNGIKNLWQEHLSRGTSLIAYSQRPYYYQQLVRLARACHEYKLMAEIGERVVHDAKTIWSKATTTTTIETMNRGAPSSFHQQLQAQGVRWQLEGLEGMGNMKESQRLARQHSVLLRKNSLDDCEDEYFSNEEQHQHHTKKQPEDSTRDELTPFPEAVLQWDKERQMVQSTIEPEICFWNKQPILKDFLKKSPSSTTKIVNVV